MDTTSAIANHIQAYEEALLLAEVKGHLLRKGILESLADCPLASANGKKLPVVGGVGFGMEKDGPWLSFIETNVHLSIHRKETPHYEKREDIILGINTENGCLAVSQQSGRIYLVTLEPLQLLEVARAVDKAIKFLEITKSLSL